LFQTIARLQFRLIGCRFALGDDENLWIVTDLYHDTSASAVGAALIQMQAIVDYTYDLLLGVLESGIAATEQDIDRSFELQGEARPH
jgi:hypothetical protein